MTLEENKVYMIDGHVSECELCGLRCSTQYLLPELDGVDFLGKLLCLGCAEYVIKVIIEYKGIEGKGEKI